MSATPGGFVGYLRSFDYDESWIGSSVDVVPVPPQTSRLAKLGIRLEVDRGLDPLLCTRLANRALAGGR